MFIRFVPITEVAESEYHWSLFGAIGHLQDSGDVADDARARLSEIDAWFKGHLPEPYRLSRSSKPHANDNAVCWFKASAHECIGKLREAVSILDEYDITVQMLTTDKPGYIVYEDKFQIAAVPFRHDR